MKRNKGFTVVEVAIAVAILAIASLAAVSIILSGQKIQRDSRDKFIAANLCENACMVFCAAADDSGGDAEALCQNFQTKMTETLGFAPGDWTKEGESGAELFAASLSFDSNWQPAEEGSYVCRFTFRQSGTSIAFGAEASGKEGTLCALSFEADLGGNV